jgi:hypothetical protein
MLPGKIMQELRSRYIAELIVMTRLAEGGCCTALPSQFAYTESRNRISRTSPP